MITQRAPQLIGESPAWLGTLEHASRVAPLERPLLLIGERGTGKELIGERLHFLSSRWEGPFIKVNCAALSDDLLDSELFGHERGAFTGATDRRAGRFELANGGTLFLDEIATASQRVQEKLLRVVEYGEYQRLGGETVLVTDVRVIAATNVDLPAAVEQGAFRADLLDRLAFDVITLPPLRARTGDTSLLADYFARRMAVELRIDFPGFAPSAIAAIEAHPWPGNVRELRNFAERLTHKALIEAPTDPVRFDPSALDPFASPWRPASPHAPADRHGSANHQPASVQAASHTPQSPAALPAMADSGRMTVLPGDFQDAVNGYEMQLIDTALSLTNQHQGQAAERLGLTYHQFRGLLKKHGYGKKGRAPDTSETALSSPIPSL